MINFKTNTGVPVDTSAIYGKIFQRGKQYWKVTGKESCRGIRPQYDCVEVTQCTKLGVEYSKTTRYYLDFFNKAETQESLFDSKYPVGTARKEVADPRVTEKKQRAAALVNMIDSRKRELERLEEELEQLRVELADK